MVQRAKRLDRRGPDWVGVGISVVLVIFLGWLCVDAYNKVGVRRDIVEALDSGDVKRVQSVLNGRSATRKDKSMALADFLASHYMPGGPARTVNADLVTLLLDSGADPNYSPNYVSLAYWPIYSGDEKTVKLLFARGLHMEKSQANAGTYLPQAVSHVNMLRFLLDYGLPIGGKGEAGESALVIAEMQNLPDSVKVLLDRGVSPNINVQNESALCTALSMQYWEIARALVLHHADVNAHGVRGRTPLSIVRSLNRPDMIAFLKAHGAK